MAYAGVFWNVERFFAPEAGAIARTLGAAKKWNRAVYNAKLRNTAAVLDAISKQHEIALIGFVEVENRQVLADLCAELSWTDMVDADEYAPQGNFDGNDVALLYSRKVFRERPLLAQSLAVNNVFSTRDVLQVRLVVRGAGHEVDVMVLHWPSRKIAEGSVLRLAHAYYVQRMVTDVLKFPLNELLTRSGDSRLPDPDLLEQRWNRPVLLLGDYNDEPFDESVRQALRTSHLRQDVVDRGRLAEGAKTVLRTYHETDIWLYNPCWHLISAGRPCGTFYREGTWRIYDQVIASHGALLPTSPMQLVEGSLRVFSEPQIEYGRTTVEMATRGGMPREFSPETGTGVSDHFPLVFELDFPASVS